MSHFWGFQALFALAGLMVLPLQNDGLNPFDPSHKALRPDRTMQSSSVVFSQHRFHEPIILSPLTLVPFEKPHGETLLR